MLIRYDTKRLNGLIKDIFDLTGISISVLDTDHNVLAICSLKEDYCTTLHARPYESMLCQQCDQQILDRCQRSGKLEHHICWAGLYDSAMPIIKYDQLVGYVLMGRVRSTQSPQSPDHFPEVGPKTQSELYDLYQRIPVLQETQLSALYSLLPSILFDNAIMIIYDPLITDVLSYIHAHLHEKITIKTLCENFHISTNSLYESFRSNLNCTVIDYIIEQRLRQAQTRLMTSNEPIHIIAEAVGIDNDAYFCRLFKKRTGVTPAQYRRNAQAVHK